MRSPIFICVALGLAALSTGFGAEPGPGPNEVPSLLDRDIFLNVPGALSGNPAAITFSTGSGLAGRLMGFKEDSGVTIGGLWLADTNGLVSGGAEPGKWSWNSLLVLSALFDAEKLVGWKGATFGIQFLQFDGENTNGQAGSVQGYNGIVATAPYDRSELYQVWVRQTFFDDKVSIRVGKVVPTYDFNNVLKPNPMADDELNIPAVSGLLFTPVFVNPTLLGAIGGYYNSVCGLTVNLAPSKHLYLNYGFYDGNVALGKQTGMTGPSFNGYYFNILEAGVAWALFDGRYPGKFAAGAWYQSGVLQGPPGISDNGTGGIYAYASQRLWGAPERAASSSGDGKSAKGADGKSRISVKPGGATPASVSTYLQFGVNNSETLPVNQYFGMGLTGFGLVPGRPSDSLGAGLAWSWLNPNLFDRPSELMFQAYYQAHVVGTTFLQPTVSYIPTPGASADLDAAWALTLRLTVLF